MCSSRQFWVVILCPFIAALALADEVEQNEAESADTVIVTGSAITRETSETTAPITVIDKVHLDGAGLLSVGDLLQDLPSQSNAINTQFNNGGDGTTRVDLRGLRSTRTLVLLNGRRIVAGGTGADGSVDLNFIPLAMISRIEVLRDSASAVYGSDAIGGVVNIITRDDLRGSEGDAYVGASSESDGTTYGLSVAFGGGGGDSGYLLGASFTRQEAVWAGDRAFAASEFEYDFETGEVFVSGSTATPNGLLFRDEFDEMFDPGNALYQAEVEAGCPMPPSGFIACTRDVAGGPWREFDFDTDLYNFQPDNYLITPAERYSLFATGNREFGNGARAFGELLYTNNRSEQRLAAVPLFGDLGQFFISRDSIHNPYGKDFFLFRRRLVEAGGRRFTQDIDLVRVVAGLNGELPWDFRYAQDWTWELSLNYGRVTADQQNRGDIILSRLNEGLGPSFVDEGGAPRCGTQGPLPGPGDDDVIPGCVPVSLLNGAGSVTPEMLDFIEHRSLWKGHNEQHVALARFAGRILETPWNGHLSAAFGAEYREESGAFIPDAFTISGDTSGSTITPIDGSYDLTEGFVELSFVPVTDRQWLQRLEFNGAARSYRYNSFASGTVWDLGALWRTEGGITLRGNYSTAFRGPGIAELFNGAQVSFGFAPDFCDADLGFNTDPNVAARCAAEGLPPTYIADSPFFAPVRNGGNPELRAETAETYTVGLVFEPPWVQGLSLSVDYFDITVERGIASLFASRILENCYFNPDGARRNCDQITRDPGTGFITLVDAKPLNVAGNRTSGYDFAASYVRDLGGRGRLSLLVEATYLDNFEDVFDGDVTEGVGVYDLDGVYPRLKTSSTVRWERGPLAIAANFRSISSIIECDFFACFDPFVREMLSRKVSANYTTDLLASYQWQSSFGTSTFRLGVNNAFDEPPAAIYNGFLGNSDASAYDYMGRFFYAGYTHKY